MNKKFDSVKFQRQRRTELSKKIAPMSTKEIVKFFKTSVFAHKPKKKRSVSA